MEQDNRANVARLKDEVIQEYGVNRERDDLPHDVRRWVELIHEHLTSEELSVSWLKAQTAGADTSGKFKAVTGKRPKSYITWLRVEWAKQLLKYGCRDCWDVAVWVGFGHRTSLSKSFKKYTGLTPSEFIGSGEKFTR